MCLSKRFSNLSGSVTQMQQQLPEETNGATAAASRASRTLNKLKHYIPEVKNLCIEDSFAFWHEHATIKSYTHLQPLAQDLQ